MLKNLKRVISITLLSAFMLSANAFAEYTDVPEKSDVHSAVQVLSSLDILSGYDDNTFKPDNNITRAEMCAVICRALALNKQSYDEMNAGSVFKDVPAEHWARGYINTAAAMKIVSGMGDDTFNPEGNITYEQAVKMIVCALGYEPMAAARGGWPQGYLNVAKQCGILNGLNIEKTDSIASRGIISQLMYNALPVPIMMVTSFDGAEATFTVMDGTGVTDENDRFSYLSLYTFLGITKINGSIVGTNEKEYNNTKCGADEVVYRFNQVEDGLNESSDSISPSDNTQDSDKKFWETYLSENADKDNYACYTFKFENGTPVNQYLDVSSEIYVKRLSDDTYTIIDIRPLEEQ